jgi:hypothetical protein
MVKAIQRASYLVNGIKKVTCGLIMEKPEARLVQT